MRARVAVANRYMAEGRAAIGGPKVNAFIDSLLLVNDSFCCDTHMSAIVGHKADLMKPTAKWARKRRQFARVVRRVFGSEIPLYRQQAILWCGYLSVELNYTEARAAAITFEGVNE